MKLYCKRDCEKGNGKECLLEVVTIQEEVGLQHGAMTILCSECMTFVGTYGNGSEV